MIVEDMSSTLEQTASIVYKSQVQLLVGQKAWILESLCGVLIPSPSPVAKLLATTSPVNTIFVPVR